MRDKMPSPFERNFQEKTGIGVLQSEEEAINRYVEQMKFSRVSARELWQTFLFAHGNLPKLARDLDWCKEMFVNPEINQRPGLDTHAVARALLDYMVAVYDAAHFCLALVRATNVEIWNRINRSRPNRVLGALLLAWKADNKLTQARELEKLHMLGKAIAGKNNWSNLNWEEATDDAVLEQMSKCSDLDANTILLRMIEGDFRVIGNAIKKNLIDEYRAIKRRKLAIVKAKQQGVLNVPPTAPPDERETAASLLDMLDDKSGQWLSPQKAVIETLEKFRRDPNQLDNTNSQLKEAFIRELARVRRRTDRMVRNNLKAFLANVEIKEATVKQLLKISAER